MLRRVTTIILLAICMTAMASQVRNTVVADSATRIPLPNASIYDKNGKAIGISDNKGILPKIPQRNYPITITYIGFNKRKVLKDCLDTIFLSESVSDLPEVFVESRRHRILHMLAYVREYSTLTTYTDTVSLFREKMVDYMIPQDHKSRFKGWSTPRVLASKSYYRFTNSNGLDSVSDSNRHHFSWSDWIGVNSKKAIPMQLRNTKNATDTLFGKYTPSEIWEKVNDKITVDINILSDTTNRKWVPGLAAFFGKNIDFEKFKVNYSYTNIIGDTVSAPDLTGYSFTIESNGRGHDMFRFNRKDEPFFVSTQADIYILDKEYITLKEAVKWDKKNFDIAELDIYEPLDAPALSSSTKALIDRVNRLDKDNVRLDFRPDHRMISENHNNRNFRIGRRALLLLKQATGVTMFRSRNNMNKNWNKFRNGQLQKNTDRGHEE